MGFLDGYLLRGLSSVEGPVLVVRRGAETRTQRPICVALRTWRGCLPIGRSAGEGMCIHHKNPSVVIP